MDYRLSFKKGDKFIQCGWLNEKTFSGGLKGFTASIPLDKISDLYDSGEAFGKGKVYITALPYTKMDDGGRNPVKTKKFDDPMDDDIPF